MISKIDIIFKALSDANRRKIIRLLRRKSAYPSDLSMKLGISKPAVSGHLKILYHAGLVEKEKEGNNIRYFINTSVLEELVTYVLEIINKEFKDDQ